MDARLPRPPSRRWVKFDDGEEDVTAGLESSLGSSSGVESLGASPPATLAAHSTSAMPPVKAPLAFTQSLECAATFARLRLNTVKAAAAAISDPCELGKQRSASGDRYSVLAAVKPGGWSGRVRHGLHASGWSRELLDYDQGQRASSGDSSAVTSDQEDESNAASADADVELGGIGDGNWFRAADWRRTEDRSFARNFP